MALFLHQAELALVNHDKSTTKDMRGMGVRIGLVSFFLLHLVLDTGDIKITNLREDNITISRQRVEVDCLLLAADSRGGRASQDGLWSRLLPDS